MHPLMFYVTVTCKWIILYCYNQKKITKSCEIIALNPFDHASKTDEQLNGLCMN